MLPGVNEKLRFSFLKVDTPGAGQTAANRPRSDQFFVARMTIQAGVTDVGDSLCRVFATVPGG